MLYHFLRSTQYIVVIVIRSGGLSRIKRNDACAVFKHLNR